MTAPTFDWHYLPSGKKSHAVYLSALSDTPMQAAMCGAQILALLPEKVRWQDDSEGLAVRERCVSCVKSVEGIENARRVLDQLERE